MLRAVAAVLFTTMLAWAGDAPAGEAKPGTLAWSLAQAKSLPDWRMPEPNAPIIGDPGQPAFDDAAWKPRTLPWDWTAQQFSNDPSKPPSGSYDAVNWGGEITGLRALWFRTTFDLPAGWKGKELVLSLGVVGEQDETWVNGKKVGGRCDPLADRSYRLPASLLKDQGNVVAVFVRHEAPGVQQAHVWWFWGHNELGGNPFWPAGIHERAPSIRPLSVREANEPVVVAGLPCLPDLAVPPKLKPGEAAPVYDLTLEITRPGDLPFFQAGATRFELLLTLSPAAELAAEQLPDLVRLEVLGVDGRKLLTRDLPAKLEAGKPLELKTAIELPSPGWFRITAQPCRKGKPLAFPEGRLGGRRAVDVAVLPPQKAELLTASRFGICTELTPATMPAILAVGARWVRWDLPWDRFEHEQGKYVFSKDHPQLWGGVKLCQENKLAMMPVFGYCAQWNVHPEVKANKDLYWLFSPPADPEAFGRASQRLAEEFKGVIQAYEIWNEPSLGHFLIGVEKMTAIQTYIHRIFPYAAKGIRAGDPAAKIIFAAQWAEPFGEGMRHIPDFDKLTDGSGIHPYCNDEPELGSFARVSTLTMRSAQVKETGKWKRDPEDTVGWFSPAKPGKYAIWNTESGWFPADVKGELAVLSQAFNRRHVASFIPRAYCAATWRGAERFFFFALHEIFDPSSSQPRPGAVAYSVTSSMLERCDPLSLVYLRRGLPCYVWQRNDDPTRFVGVLWSQGLDYLCILPEGVTGRDLQGRVLAPKDGAVRVGEEAIFLEVKAATPVAARNLIAGIQAVGLGNGSTLNLWLKAGESESWRKRIGEVVDAVKK